MAGGYPQDILTNIVNVQWGGDLTVVFMEVSPFDPQPVFEYTLKQDDVTSEDKATFLGSWMTPSYSTDPAPFKNTAYKVKSGAGVFITSKAPGLPTDIDFNGTWLNVLVFAKGIGLEEVKDATKLMAPALYIVNASNADLPAKIAPPGLLWGVTTGAFAEGVSLDWKIRFGEHRPPESTSTLPDAMVQCYPLGPSHPGYIGDAKATYTGYFLIAYRLDSAGTGDVYSESPNITDVDHTQSLPPQWNVPIEDSIPLRGIPFADPPPLIDDDVQSTLT